MSLLRIIITTLVIGSITGCNHTGIKPEFKDWLALNRATLSTSGSTGPDSISVRSDLLNIDTIYRSMQGPYSRSTLVDLAQIPSDIIWLTGYKCEVFNAETDERIADEFLCHNNLNYCRPDSYPWKIKTLGSEKRIFTLTAGQTRINLPEGMGVPIKTGNNLQFFSQALNHNYDSIDLPTYQKVTIYYREDGSSTNNIIPLYTQTPFVTTKIGGPDGGFNESTSEQYIPELICGFDSSNTCHISFPSNAEYNPYRDEYGRTYNGHWNLDSKKQSWTTNITNMLNLFEKETVVAIGAHVHPYAINVELWDLTNNNKLYDLSVDNYHDKIGLNRIEYNKNVRLDLDNNIQYALRTNYHCTDSVHKHTGMANLGLYIME